MEKLLVCGSAGFLMSNFIRYLFYRAGNVEIVSIDDLKDIRRYRHLYINKNHKFYLGNICDKTFLEKLIFIENPDYIINGCFYNNNQNNSFDEIINGTQNLINSKIPLIQVCGCNDVTYDKLGFWNFISKMLCDSNNSCIEIPNSFGLRQKLSVRNPIVWILHNLLENNKISVKTNKLPWVFVEDIASLIWFIIEKKIKGHLKMPVLGFMSEEDISINIKNMFNTSYDVLIDNKNEEFMVTNYEISNIKEWKPDSTSIEDALTKTIKWYDANRWCLGVPL